MHQNQTCILVKSGPCHFLVAGVVGVDVGGVGVSIRALRVARLDDRLGTGQVATGTTVGAVVDLRDVDLDLGVALAGAMEVDIGDVGMGRGPAGVGLPLAGEAVVDVSDLGMGFGTTGVGLTLVDGLGGTAFVGAVEVRGEAVVVLLHIDLDGAAFLVPNGVFDLGADHLRGLQALLQIRALLGSRSWGGSGTLVLLAVKVADGPVADLGRLGVGLLQALVELGAVGNGGGRRQSDNLEGECDVGELHFELM
ncbi:hypothetical protein PG987_005246 [Apiospora arundinis]